MRWRDRHDRADIPALTVLLVLVGVVAWTLIVWQRGECMERGGTFVRGVLWFECVGTKP